MLHRFELELAQRDVLVVRLEDDVFGAEVELALILALGFAGCEIVEGAVSEEVHDIDLVLLHVVEVEPFGVGRRHEQHTAS